MLDSQPKAFEMPGGAAFSGKGKRINSKEADGSGTDNEFKLTQVREEVQSEWLAKRLSSRDSCGSQASATH